MYNIWISTISNDFIILFIINIYNKTKIAIQVTNFNPVWKYKNNSSAEYSGGRVVYNLVPINVEGNLLGLAHDYILNQLTILNPGVTFTKVGLI
jgi:hypothetical protein